MRPRIKRTTERIETPEGDVLLMRPSGGADIKIERPDERDRRLLGAFNGTQTLDQLYAEFGRDDVDQLVCQLQELEVLEDGADDDLVSSAELERFDRQLRYFSDVREAGGPTPSECQRRLREAKVAVLGTGGLGGAAALWLASIGVGEMWLVDGDRVEISNLNRQILYTEADIGLHKVEIAASRLRAFNSSMRVTATARRLESAAEVADFVAGADIVVDSADWPAHDFDRWCNEACFEVGVPFITMSHFPPIARVGPLFVPGRTGCFACQEEGFRQEHPLFDMAIEQLRAQPKPAGTLGPACGLTGGQVGIEVMHYLTGLVEPLTLGVGHRYDLRTMELTRDVVEPQPGCAVCGHLAHEPLGERAGSSLAD
jgi:bacteriocin biosynthesis cyclodehydratase domain-containing protein